uniref:Uncharacterized protein n=1 Tax=Stomoxys calcitrans TaxID=35570 RepID=A0A1I8NX39_STOCA
MSLSLTTRRRDKTLSNTKNKWSSQQQLSSALDKSHQQHPHQPVRKQRSFIESSSSSKFQSSCNSNSVGNSRPNLTRGLSVGRTQDIQQRLGTNKHILRKTSSINTYNSNNGPAIKSPQSNDLIKRNITACGQLDRPSRSVQAWSSTSSILKSLDKELAQLNNSLVKSKDIRNDIEIDRLSSISNVTNGSLNKPTSKTKTDSGLSTVVTAANTKSNKTSSNTNAAKETEANKVNLSIVLSHALNASKENDYILCDPGDEDESEDTSTDSEKLGYQNSERKSSLPRDSKKPESILKNTITPAQQRRALYQSSKYTEQSNSIQTAPIVSGPQSPNSQLPFNFQSALTVQRRAPLVRAMSAPVRSIDENSKGSFLANKRKPRRRKLNTRTITCDRDSSPSDHLNNVNDLNLDPKSAAGKKILQRSRSVAPDVITLVSLISSEGSDSEKEDCPSTPTNSDCNSPTRRPPSLRKSGKSVSFQENYPPTFQFASKEYSHMLRRGSIAPLAARIKSNRPPTAPPVSIFHSNNNNSSTKLPKNMNEEDETGVLADENRNDETPTNTTTTTSKKPLEEENYQYPEYVRSIKERECWKLFQKMSAKGVNITYDTILRGMLTPTEFRQLQKQREVEEAKVLKESEELLPTQSDEQAKAKKSPSIDKLTENLLKN